MFHRGSQKSGPDREKVFGCVSTVRAACADGFFNSCAILLTLRREVARFCGATKSVPEGDAEKLMDCGRS